MSENILIGKSRKTGEWQIIVQPGEPYGKVLEAYRKLSSAAPVSDEFSRVLCGRIQNTSSPLSLITSEQKELRDKSALASRNVAVTAGKNAVARQSAIEEERNKQREEAHAEALEEKNSLIDAVRSATNQPPAAAEEQPEQSDGNVAEEGADQTEETNNQKKGKKKQK